MDTLTQANSSNSSAGVPSSENNIEGWSSKLVLWFILQIAGGQVLLPILVATFIFSKRAKRDATLINLCITFIPTSVFACLLLYAGQATGPEPNKTLCIVQASLVTTCPPMWALALFGCVFHLWKTINVDPEARRYPQSLRLFLLALPYLIFVVLSITTAVLSAYHPDHVTRNRRQLYCSLNYSFLGNAIAIITLVICVVVIGFSGHLLHRIIESWRALRLHGGAKRTAPCANVRLAVRLCIFMVYILAGTVFSIWSIAYSGEETSARDVFMASLAIAVFALFGTQRDVFHVLCFWRKPPQEEDGDDVTLADSPTSSFEKYEDH